MATKKQKRLANLAKHEAFMAEERERGLAAQKKDHEHRAAKKRKADAEAARQKNSPATKLLNAMFPVNDESEDESNDPFSDRELVFSHKR